VKNYINLYFTRGLVMKDAVLFLAAGGPHAICAIKSLRMIKNPDFFLIGADFNEYSSGLELVDKKYVVPSSLSNDYLDSLLDILDEENPRYVFPGHLDLVTLAKNKFIFEKMGAIPIISSLETINDCINKKRTYKKCSEHSIPIPELYESQISFPCIIKPVYGKGTKGVYFIETNEEFDLLEPYLKKKYGEIIIQEYIPGIEFSCDVLSDKWGEVLCVVPRKRLGTYGGVSVQGVTTSDSEVIAFVKCAVSSFGLRGPSNVQVMKNEYGIFLLEINPRLSGSHILTTYSGVNLPYLSMKVFSECNIDEGELQWVDNVFMTRYFEEIFFRRNH